MPDFDSSFLALPLRELAGAALSRAQELGAEHADFRCERSRTASLALRDARLDSSSDSEDIGLAVRVVHDGAWGFASGIVRTASAAAELADQAVETARISRVLSSEPVELAAEPVYDDVTWISAYELNPFHVPDLERIARLTELSERLLAADGVDHVDTHVTQVIENKFYADTRGTTTTQQRVRIQPQFTVVHVDRSANSFSSMRTLAPRPHAAGSTSPAPAGISTPRSPNCPGCCSNTSSHRASQPAPTTWSSMRPICGSPSTSRSGTPPNSTVLSATRPPTRGRALPPSTSSTRCSTAARS